MASLLKWVGIRQPEVRVSRTGLDILAPRLRIGPKRFGLNLSPRGFSADVGTGLFRYNTKHGMGIRLPCCSIVAMGLGALGIASVVGYFLQRDEPLNLPFGSNS